MYGSPDTTDAVTPPHWGEGDNLINETGITNKPKSSINIRYKPPEYL